MSKMLDVLEVFLNLHGHTYMRLDGATKPEQRQILMQRFNTDPKVPSQGGLWGRVGGRGRAVGRLGGWAVGRGRGRG